HFCGNHCRPVNFRGRNAAPRSMRAARRGATRRSPFVATTGATGVDRARFFVAPVLRIIGASDLPSDEGGFGLVFATLSCFAAFSSTAARTRERELSVDLTFAAPDMARNCPYSFEKRLSCQQFLWVKRLPRSLWWLSSNYASKERRFPVMRHIAIIGSGPAG